MIATIEPVVEILHGHTEILCKPVEGVQRWHTIAAEYPGETGYSYSKDFGDLFPVHLDWLYRLIHHSINYTTLMPNCQMGYEVEGCSRG